MKTAGAFDSSRLARVLLLGVLLLTVAGCSWIKSFGDDEEDEDAELEPAELVDFEPEIRVREEWSVGIGNGQGKLFNRIHPALYGDMIIAAAANGTVEAVDAATGKTRWDADLDIDLAGGVGAGGDLVVVGTDKGGVIALESASGRELWRSTVSGEVLAPPAADWDVVVVQTLDGKLHGLDTSSGARRWTQDSSMPLLTLRGTAGPVLSEGVVYAALANGRVIAVKADSGTLLWDGRIATPQGQSEIERAVDIDGKPLLVQDALYAVSYQGKLGGLQLGSGRPLWARDASSYVGISEGFGNLYVAETSGTVSAFELDGGALRWQYDALQRRQLSAPAAIGSYVAVADLDGYVHFLSQVDGHLAGRARADSDGVRADMIVHDGRLYTYGNDGELSCFTIEAR